MRNDLIYLARPIDLARVAPSLVDYAVGELQALGLPSYDPLGAFNAAGRPSGVINRVNEAAMRAATGAVAFLPKDASSVGVPSEIAFLQARGVPTLVVTDHTTSWVVAGWREHPTTQVQELTEEGISSGIDWLMETVSLVGQQAEPMVFERKNPNAVLPTRGYDTDAGYDLYACETIVVPARGQAMVSCGVAADIPEGMWAQITGRSSTLKRYNLMVAPTVGVIDEGYTGELYAPVVSISDQDVKIETGQRIAQLILHHAPGQAFRPTWGLTRNKDRGENGFGSTGR